MRWSRLGLAIAICMLLLTWAGILMSRYRANRSLMRLGRQDIGVSVAWKGTSFNWLRRTIGSETEQALLGYPSGVVIQGTLEDFSDQAVSDLLGQLDGLESIQIHHRDLPTGCLETIATRHRVETLAFRHPCIRQDDAKWLSRMPSLKQVTLGPFVWEPREN